LNYATKHIPIKNYRKLDIKINISICYNIFYIQLKANFIYSDLNPCGGGERLTIVTMQTTLEMGFDIELTTLKVPNTSKIENAFGKDLALVIGRIKKIHILNHILDIQRINSIMQNGYDLVINTHGDIDPFYHESFLKNNAITYCHYPTTKHFVDMDEDNEYIEKHLEIAKSTSLSLDFTNTNTTSQKKYSGQNTISFDRKRYYELIKENYDKMMLNSTILTNSEYSSKAISDAYGIKDAIILAPPVDVEQFRSLLIPSSSYPLSYLPEKDDDKEDFVIVISRIEPSKKIDNAIKIAKILKEKKIAKGMIIAGNIEQFYYDYIYNIKEMIKNLDLEDFVSLKTNCKLEKLCSLLKRSKVFFHPRYGEHFGISIVEAMSAGLIPVVTAEGGQTEFVPKKYQYHSIEQAVDIISSALNVPYSERVSISDSVQRFSSLVYKNNFKEIVNQLLQKNKSKTINENIPLDKKLYN
jgi:glycosyltransferase involved in cell wall biosynthesis